MAIVTYYLDGVDIREEYGVHVSKSKGFLGAPKTKRRQSVDIPDMHGTIPVGPLKYDDRTMELECFMHADSAVDFASSMMSFVQYIKSKPSMLLIVDVREELKLGYAVSFEDEIDVSKEWSESDMVGTFTLKMVDHKPQHILMRFEANNDGETMTARFNTKKPLTIYFGDGEMVDDVCIPAPTQSTSTTSVTMVSPNAVVTHTYEDEGVYYVLVCGDIDDITAFSYDAEQAIELMWEDSQEALWESSENIIIGSTVTEVVWTKY